MGTCLQVAVFSKDEHQSVTISSVQDSEGYLQPCVYIKINIYIYIYAWTLLKAAAVMACVRTLGTSSQIPTACLSGPCPFALIPVTVGLCNLTLILLGFTSLVETSRLYAL